jgi:Holliday junction resolvase RusA-like endonuclease
MTKIILSRVPPSANNLFGTNRKTGARFKTRGYVTWIKFSQAEVMMQRPAKHTARVDILIRIPQSQVRASSDASNRIKAAEDLIVSMGVIPDDKQKYVRSTKAEFADIPQTEIIITDVEAEQCAA